jgi:AraC-like DNA-binding protein
MQYFNYLHLKYGQIQTFPADSEVVRMAQRLIRQVAADPGRPADYWSEMTFRWLSAWWRCAKAHQKLLGPQSLEAVQPSRLISYTTKTIKNFAAEMGYSRAYLTRKLTGQWRRSPGRALREVRLAEAARLLRTTRMRIHDVAAKVGYSTSASFGQAFRHQYQQTPSAYRNTHL